MKNSIRTISMILSAILVLVFTCSAESAKTQEFRSVSDPALRAYISDTLYDELVTELDSNEYYVSDIQTAYISQEYLDEVAYNSRSNIFFGYTLSDLDEQFEGTRYVFTLGEDGQTTVKPFEAYDDTFDKILHNIAVGTGVILICVTVSVVTAGTASTAAISMIFAVAAQTGTAGAVSGAVLGGVSAGIVTGIQTGDMDQALKAAALSGSEGFKWGAITGAVAGGVSEAKGLYDASAGLHSLTINEAAQIQRESKLPLDFIRNFHSMEEYSLYRDYGLQPLNLNGTLAYTQPVDLSLVDADGLTNVQRIQKALSPIDASGTPFELHHIGQAADSPLAILTEQQHRGKGITKILHFNTGSAASEIDREVFAAEKEAFWTAYLDMFGGTF